MDGRIVAVGLLAGCSADEPVERFESSGGQVGESSTSASSTSEEVLWWVSGPRASSGGEIAELSGAALWIESGEVAYGALASCPDLDGDGRPEVLAGDALDVRSWLLSGAGVRAGGILQDAVLASVEGAAEAACVRDLDGDRLPELLVSSAGSEILVFPGYALDGTLSSDGARIRLQAAEPERIEGLPIRGERGLVLVVASEGGRRVVEGVPDLDGSSLQAPPEGGVSLPPGGAVTLVRIGDVDGDGAADIAARWASPEAISAWVIPAAALRDPPPEGASAILVSEMLPGGDLQLADLGDVDGDGLDDLLIRQHRGNEDTLGVVLAGALGAGFARQWPIEGTGPILAGRLDPDGLRDAVIESGGGWAVLSGASLADPAWDGESEAWIASPLPVRGAIVGDLDQDGVEDLVFGSR